MSNTFLKPTLRWAWLIRHGQSMSQIDNTVSGVNPPLSPLGEEQARALIPRVKDLQPDIIFVSPLIRACRTYQLSEISGKRVMFNKCAMESNWNREDIYAEVDFQSQADIAELDLTDNHLRDTRVRAELLVDEIVSPAHESFVVFGHWGIFSQLFKTFFGVEGDIEARAINQNTAISKLIITDENIRQLEYWNDHGHVPGLETTL